MPKQIRPYMDFSGGLNKDKSLDRLADNELQEAQNVVLDLRGALASRKGCVPFNITSFSGAVTQVFEWARTVNDTRLLAVIDWVLCEFGNDGSCNAIRAVDSSKIAFTPFQDRLYFVDGDDFYVYDGTACAAVVPNEGDGVDIDSIRKCRFLLWNPRNYRFYAAGNSDDPAAVYFSQPNEPDNWLNKDVIYPAQAEGPVTALTLFAHAMVVFFADSCWVWKGIDPEMDATWTRVPVPYGTLAPHSIALTPSSLTWLANGAIVSMSPAVLDYNVTLLPGTELVANICAEKVSALTQCIYHPDTAVGVYDVQRGRYLLAYGDDINERTNNRVLVYDWQLRGFTTFTGWEVSDWCFRPSTRELLFASEDYLLIAETGYMDWDCHKGDYAPIDVYVATKFFNLDLPFFIKRNSKLFISGQVAGGQAPVVDLEVRSTGPKSKTVYLPAVSFNDGMVWGDVWGSLWPYEDAVTIECKAKCQGERFQVRLRLANPGGSLNLYGLAFVFRPKTQPKGVKYTNG